MQQRCDFGKIIFENRREILTRQIVKYLDEKVHHLNMLLQDLFIALVRFDLLISALPEHRLVRDDEKECKRVILQVTARMLVRISPRRG
jgi:hypothetical protein